MNETSDPSIGLTLDNVAERLSGIPAGDFDKLDALRRRYASLVGRAFGENSQHVVDVLNIHTTVFHDPMSLGSSLTYGIEARQWRDAVRDFGRAIAYVDEDRRVGDPAFDPSSVAALLHPLVRTHAMEHYLRGDYREAVVNAMLALSGRMQQRTGLDADGTSLANLVFSPSQPLLEFTHRSSVSERDEHSGFHKIVLGAFEGIRNPKTHSLEHDLDAMKAAQYLVFISLLLRRVDEAYPVPASGR